MKNQLQKKIRDVFEKQAELATGLRGLLRGIEFACEVRVMASATQIQRESKHKTERTALSRLLCDMRNLLFYQEILESMDVINWGLHVAMDIDCLSFDKHVNMYTLAEEYEAVGRLISRMPVRLLE
jgi:hypothetical protein